MATELIKKGYKQTEVGVIPNDWYVQNILKNSTLKARIGWQGLTTKEYLKTGNFLLVGGTDFKDGKIDWENCFYVDEKRYSQDKNIQLEEGDVLVTKDGTIGKISYVDNLKLPTTLNSGVFVIRPKHKNYMTQYFFYILTSDFFDKFLNKLKAGSTISHLYQKDFSSFDFILPKSLEEQSAIASVLSDTDALIESLDKLIVKKKNIKQGTMQKLLSGKRRLPGFKEEWNSNKLNDLILNITTGLNPRKNFTLGKGNNYYITIKNFKKGKLYLDDNCDKVSNEAINLINKRSNLESGDILFASIGIEPSTYLIKKTPTDWNINESVFSIKPNKNIMDSRFLQYLLTADWIFSKLTNDATGSTFQSIKIKQLKNLELTYPLLEEQQKISLILSDMDSEIESLERKRDKYTLLKTGMMQELLTGRIRLK
ncbi:restriction endonuclease subunit S [Candidatus Pacearchaeota archaeon]|nr:restriction endonuclease subunit S [Candidatus Pacearchaeota archaeon]